MQPVVKPLPSLKIAIQNASTQPGLTEKVINSLKQKGFAKAYAASDWSDPQRETLIIVQKGNRQLGEQMQKALGFGQISVPLQLERLFKDYR